MLLQVNASHDGLRQSVSEYEATVHQLQSELAETKEQHQEAREEVGVGGGGCGGKGVWEVVGVGGGGCGGRWVWEEVVVGGGGRDGGRWVWEVVGVGRGGCGRWWVWAELYGGRYHCRGRGNGDGIMGCIELTVPV